MDVVGPTSSLGRASVWLSLA